jgi:hypothetical protein
MNRRAFIKAASVAALTAQLNAEEKLRPGLKKNVVLICSDFGFEVNNWATSYQDIFDPFKDKMTLFKNINQPSLRKGHEASHGILTCLSYNNRHRFIDKFVSLDQYIVENSKRERRFKSLYYQASFVKGVSWNSQAQAMPSINDPRLFYQHVFGPVKLKLESAELQEKKLVYETLANEVSKHSKNSNDSKKMVHILESNIKDINIDLEWLKVPKPKVKPLFHSDDKVKDTYISIDKALDVVRLATEKKQTGVSVVHLSETSRRIPLEDISRGYHDLTHSCHKDADSLKQLVEIDTHVLSSVAGFVADLENKNLLDETVVLLVGSMGDASTHSNKNLPVILFGGGFNHKNSLDCIKDGELKIPLSNVYNSILKQLGMKTKRFAGLNKTVEELFV